MNLDSKIYIAGHNGMVGSAILRNLKSKGYTNFVFTPYPQYDLVNQQTVETFFEKEKPEYVILAAAKVGGILANNIYRGQFIFENLQIQNNIIHQSYVHGVKKLLFLGSSCIYPKNAPQPMEENYLLTSELEYTNEPYAIAKIAGLKLCESYNIQYGTNFIAVMPTNLYGLNDNFDLEKSHVLPAIMRKLYLGKCLIDNNWEAIRKDLNKYPIGEINGSANESDILKSLQKFGIQKDKTVSVELWGSGSPKREFLFADDLADSCIYLMENIDFKGIIKALHNEDDLSVITKKQIRNVHINIGTGVDQTIKELAEKIREVVGFTGEIVWNTSKPDGTPQKLLNVNTLHKLGWKAKTSLDEGLKKFFNFYLS